jgi:hypothetical protein
MYLSFSGGGNVKNVELNKFGPALRWMTYEAIGSGIRMKPFEQAWEEPVFNESMTSVWKALELVPLRQLSYADEDSMAFR